MRGQAKDTHSGPLETTKPDPLRSREPTILSVFQGTGHKDEALYVIYLESWEGQQEHRACLGEGNHCKRAP